MASSSEMKGWPPPRLPSSSRSSGRRDVRFSSARGDVALPVGRRGTDSLDAVLAARRVRRKLNHRPLAVPLAVHQHAGYGQTVGGATNFEAKAEPVLGEYRLDRVVDVFPTSRR